MKQESSAINPYNGMFGQQGWICPKCGRVYSPFTQMCLYCKPNNTNTISNLGDISNTTVSEEKLRENRKTDSMKQTVEEASREYADSVINSFGRNGVPNGISDIKEMLTIAFENGAEWQSKQSTWISVKERLPEEGDPVLIRLKDGVVRLACYDIEEDSNMYFWNDNYSYETIRAWDVTHWMPIPSFDENLETNKDDLNDHIDKVKMEIIRIVANDAQAVTFQTLGQYRSWLMKTINELSYPIPEL
ncbi:DUF551 domain-containing protein [Bacteroides fragilis]|nr:DUF551 domain-containing protein [Bacteroides fragilis]